MITDDIIMQILYFRLLLLSSWTRNLSYIIQLLQNNM
jgi:hypothetical protein